MTGTGILKLLSAHQKSVLTVSRISPPGWISFVVLLLRNCLSKAKMLPGSFASLLIAPTRSSARIRADGRSIICAWPGVNPLAPLSSRSAGARSWTLALELVIYRWSPSRGVLTLATYGTPGSVRPTTWALAHDPLPSRPRTTPPGKPGLDFFSGHSYRPLTIDGAACKTLQTGHFNQA